MPGINKSGALPIGADYKPIQVGCGLRNRDASVNPVAPATVAPIESPFLLGNTPQLITPPQNACNMIVRCESNFRYGDNALLSNEVTAPVPGGGWQFGPANQDVVIDVGDQRLPLYLRCSSADGGPSPARCWIAFNMVT